MRNTSRCVTLLMYMFSRFSVSIEELKAVFAALAVPMPRLVLYAPITCFCFSFAIAMYRVFG